MEGTPHVHMDEAPARRAAPRPRAKPKPTMTQMQKDVKAVVDKALARQKQQAEEKQAQPLKKEDADASKVEKKNPAEKKPEKEVSKKKEEPKRKKPKVKKKKLTKKEKAQLRKGKLNQAGIDIDLRLYDKILLKVAIGASVVEVLFMVMFALVRGYTGSFLVKWILAALFLGPVVMYGLTLVGAHLYSNFRIYQRSREVELHLPDYLQLCALNIKAGMPVDKALWLSVRPKFGVLATEMEVVAKRTITGVELSKALTDLTKRFDSPVLNRAISLLNAGIGAGGEIGDLLNKIATNISETAIMKKEMAASVTTYTIFIGFATIAAAPLLMALSYHLLSIVQGLANKLDAGGGGRANQGMMTISPDTILLSDYVVFALLSLIVTSIFSAIIISVIKRGNAQESYRIIPGMAGTAVLLFFFARWVLSTMFGGIV